LEKAVSDVSRSPRPIDRDAHSQRPELGVGLAVVARALQLLLVLFLRVLVRLMMTDDAADTGAKNGVMAGEMPGGSTYGSALQAARSLYRRGVNPAASARAKAADTKIDFMGRSFALRRPGRISVNEKLEKR